MSSGVGPGQQQQHGGQQPAATDPRKATAAALAAAAAAANRGGAALPPDQQQQQQQPQDFDSWRHQQHQAAPPGYNLASDLYGFYQQNPFHHNPYNAFGVGGEGTWSNGDHMTFLGGNPYGTPQLQGTEAQFGMDLAQFGAGAAGGFGAFTQAPGYGFDFTGSAAAGYSQWGNAAATAAGRAAAAQQQGHGAGEQQPQWGRGAATAGAEHQYYRPEHYSQEGRRGVAAAEQAMQGLNIAGSNHMQDNDKEAKVDGKDGGSKQHLDSGSTSSGGGSGSGSTPSSLAPPPQQPSSGGQPKKMSWASVASQPAKPPTTVKPKKPGVLSPPQLPSSKPPTAAGAPPTSAGVEIGTWDTATSVQHQNGAGNGLHHPGIPTSATTFGMGIPPPLFGGAGQQAPVSTMGHHMPPASRGIGANSGIGGPMGRGGAWMGGRGGGHPPASVMSNGFTPHSGMIGGAGLGHPLQHPPPSSNSVGPGAASTGAAANVLSELHATNSYNPREFDMNPVAARFFVVKSYSEDDIHRSIKYEIWCSTEHGNKRLDAAFREREGKGPVYLFYSVNGSGHFCGMAQMLSGVDYSSTSKVWAQDKWKGKFNVKWIYVKDVPNQQLRHIKLENNENKPVTNSRDTQEVPHEKGKQVLKILHAFKHNTSIFDDFSHYEKRQEEEEVRKVPHHQNGRGDRHDSNHHHPRRDNNHYHRGADDSQEYRPRGGGDRDDRRRGGDRDHEGGGGRGRGGYHDKGRGGYSSVGGRGGAHGNRRVSPVNKEGTANGGK